MEPRNFLWEKRAPTTELCGVVVSSNEKVSRLARPPSELFACLLIVSRQAHAHSSVHAVLDCCVSGWSPRRNECRDMAERVRLQGRGGRRIRAPKQSGPASFFLFRVRAKVQLVQFRARMTGPPSDEPKKTGPEPARACA